MYKLFLYLLFFCILINSTNAQWSPLNSTTTNHLNDLDFWTEDYGVIVGNQATVLLTTDGGANWTNINDGTILGDVWGVRIMDRDTIFVSTYNSSSSDGSIYLTVDGGLNWNPIYTVTGTNHRVDLESNMPGNLVAAGTHLLETATPYGNAWDSLASYIGGGTVSLDVIKFADSQVGHVSGLVSGFFAYSAYFYRTENGKDWYTGDVFSFPNADALTTMCFTHPDTALVFTNTYAGFMPSAQNHLIKTYDYNLVSAVPGDTAFAFTSQVVNATMPAYMNDAWFENSSIGFALGNDFSIYKTTNGGVNWAVDYAAAGELFRLDFINGVGYALGNSGNLVKYTVPASVESISASIMYLELAPNPATEQVQIKAALALETLSIYSVDGSVVRQINNINTNSYLLDLEGLLNGVYLLEATDVKGNVYSNKLTKVD